MRRAPGCPCFCQYRAGGVANHRSRLKKKKKIKKPPGQPKSRSSAYRWTAARCSPETCSAGPPVPAGPQPWSYSRLPGLWGRPVPRLTAAGGRAHSPQRFPVPCAPCAPQPRSAGAAAGSRSRPRRAPHLPAAARRAVRSSAPGSVRRGRLPWAEGASGSRAPPTGRVSRGDPAAAGSRGARLGLQRHPLGAAGSVFRVRLELGAEQASSFLGEVPPSPLIPKKVTGSLRNTRVSLFLCAALDQSQNLQALLTAYCVLLGFLPCLSSFPSLSV